MELLLLVVVVVLGAMMAAAWAGFGLFVGAFRRRKKAEANAPAILDAAFDGRPDVAFTVNLETLPVDTVVIGAKQRGYRLVEKLQKSSSGEAWTLMFERVRQAAEG